MNFKKSPDGRDNFISGLSTVTRLLKVLGLDIDSWPSSEESNKVAAKLKKYYVSDEAEAFAEKVLSTMPREEIEKLAMGT